MCVVSDQNSSPLGFRMLVLPLGFRILAWLLMGCKALDRNVDLYMVMRRGGSIGVNGLGPCLSLVEEASTRDVGLDMVTKIGEAAEIIRGKHGQVRGEGGDLPEFQGNDLSADGVEGFCQWSGLGYNIFTC